MVVCCLSMGRAIIFWKRGNENFSVSLSVKKFFSGGIFLQTTFFMPAKTLFGVFAFANKFFWIFHHLPMVYDAVIFVIFQYELMNSNPK